MGKYERTQNVVREETCRAGTYGMKLAAVIGRARRGAKRFAAKQGLPVKKTFVGRIWSCYRGKDTTGNDPGFVDCGGDIDFYYLGLGGSAG